MLTLTPKWVAAFSSRFRLSTPPAPCHPPQAGCWGPAPSCATCTDGCNQCAAGYAGSTCRVPIVTDVYEPDADNGVIRLTFLRDLVTYGNPYQAGVARGERPNGPPTTNLGGL